MSTPTSSACRSRRRLAGRDRSTPTGFRRAEENRSNADLARAAGQQQQAMANQASANQAKAQAWGSAISGAVGMASAVGTAGEGTLFNP